MRRRNASHESQVHHANNIAEGSMVKLIYLMNVSLDGFVETQDQGLDWTIVDEEPRIR